MATLRVVVASASSLRKVESSFMRNKNDPYVVLIPSWLPESGDTYRTGHVEDGGASVTFTSEHGSEIVLPLPTDDQMDDDAGDEFTIAVRVLDNNDKKDDVLIGEGIVSYEGMEDHILDLSDMGKQHAEENMEVALTFATVSRGRKGKAKSAGSVVLSLFYEPGQEKALGKPKQPSRPPPRKPQGGVEGGGNVDDDADSPRVEERAAAPGGESKGGEDGNDSTSRMGEKKPSRPPPRPAKANFKPSAPDGAGGSGRSIGKPPGRPVRPGGSGGGETKSGRPSAVATKAPTTQADDADGGDMEESSPPSPWQDGLLTVTVLEGIKVRPHCAPPIRPSRVHPTLLAEPADRPRPFTPPLHTSVLWSLHRRTQPDH